jgi:hypothetical protein
VAICWIDGHVGLPDNKAAAAAVKSAILHGKPASVRALGRGDHYYSPVFRRIQLTCTGRVETLNHDDCRKKIIVSLKKHESLSLHDVVF